MTALSNNFAFRYVFYINGVEVNVMARPRRFLTLLAGHRSRFDSFLEIERSDSANFPGAARFTDEEVESFWLAARSLDLMSHRQMAKAFSRAGIAYPPEYHFNEYRLSRHLLHQWENPAIREAFFRHFLAVQENPRLRLAEARSPQELYPTCDYWSSPAFLHLLRVKGLGHLVEPIVESFNPKRRAQHEGFMLHARRMLFRFVTDPGPAQARSRWEQQKVNRLIRLREVQLRSMRRNLRTVKREHKELQARLRQLARAEHPELRALATEWADLQAQIRTAEQAHQREMEHLAAAHQAELARLRAEQVEQGDTYRRVLALRHSWLKPMGGEAHAPREARPAL